MDVANGYPAIPWVVILPGVEALGSRAVPRGENRIMALILRGRVPPR